MVTGRRQDVLTGVRIAVVSFVRARWWLDTLGIDRSFWSRYEGRSAIVTDLIPSASVIRCIAMLGFAYRYLHKRRQYSNIC
jgi:hypothetical protein